jgi:xanthine dehydrogenase accessory factor
VNLSETAAVLASASSWRRENRSMALATIVAVSGSTYRRPGARLLVPERGDAVGNLSGGCLEGEVEALARDVMVDGGARLQLYDLTADDEVVWGWGLGCNGAIEVFIEPAERAAEIADALRSAIESERSIGVATVLESSVTGVDQGARLVVDDEGRRSGSIAVPEVADTLSSVLEEAMPHATATTRRLALADGELRVFVEVFEPPLRLLVCGAGHDAIPLVRLASALGWRTAVVDDRDAFLSPERFPSAGEFIHCRPEETAARARVDARTYVVVMSHNYLRDKDYLRSVLTTDAPYVGMLGPRGRTQRLLDELAGEGVALDAAGTERIHGPAGLDAGAEGPEEIAAAIVAEVLAVSRSRGAGFLRDKPGSIHERPHAVAAG